MGFFLINSSEKYSRPLYSVLSVFTLSSSFRLTRRITEARYLSRSELDSWGFLQSSSYKFEIALIKSFSRENFLQNKENEELLLNILPKDILLDSLNSYK